MAAEMPAGWPTPTTWPGGELLTPLDKALAVLAAHEPYADIDGGISCDCPEKAGQSWSYVEHLREKMREALG